MTTIVSERMMTEWPTQAAINDGKSAMLHQASVRERCGEDVSTMRRPRVAVSRKAEARSRSATPATASRRSISSASSNRSCAQLTRTKEGA